MKRYIASAFLNELMDIIVEILLEVYMELMILVVPEKHNDKKFLILSKIFAVFMIALVFALLIFGVVLITDYGNMLGMIPIGFAIAISVAQITLGIVFYIRRRRK